MYSAVDFKDGKIGIYSDVDGSVDWCTTSEVKNFLQRGIQIYGVRLALNENPMFTLDGLDINLNYRERTNFIDRFKFVILLPGQRFGRTFSSVIDKPTVFVFDLGANVSKLTHPSGMFVASYYVESLLQHEDGYGLMFDADVPAWRIDARGMRDLKEWLNYQMSLLK